jgi:hypothetical protein
VVISCERDNGLLVWSRSEGHCVATVNYVASLPDFVWTDESDFSRDVPRFILDSRSYKD